MADYLKLFNAYRLDPTIPHHKVEIDKRLAAMEVEDEVNGTANAQAMRERYEEIENDIIAKRSLVEEVREEPKEEPKEEVKEEKPKKKATKKKKEEPKGEVVADSPTSDE